MNSKMEIHDKKYAHYNDYTFRTIMQKRANGLLKFAKIPYTIDRIMISEVANLGPTISRLDFVGECQKDTKTITLILECQTKLLTDDDIKRFFQYVSSIRVFKNNPVELYILCIEKAPYTKKTSSSNRIASIQCTLFPLKISKLEKYLKELKTN